MSFSEENSVIVSSGGSETSMTVDDQVPVDQPRPLRWFLPGFFDGVENDDVDTTLRLCPPGTFIQQKPKKVLKEIISRHDDEKKNKKRSRWQDAEASTPPARGGGGGGDDETTKKRRHININGEDQWALVPIDPEIGGLMRTVLLRGGSRPVFLYKKKLDECDVKNRLFLNRGERVMEYLLREVDGAGDGKGVTVFGVDGGGRVYEKLVMNKWASLNMIVINSDWNKVVEANKAHKGQIMEIWGYKENHKPCLAFNFRVERDGSSTTT